MYYFDMPVSHERRMPVRSYDPFSALRRLERASAQLMNANAVGNSVDEVGY
jgi:hypothetical protein